MRFANTHGKRKGFTLIELMVSIAIIGILTAVVIANAANSKAKARDAKRVADIAQIQLALELYYNRCNQYPVTLSSTAGDGCPNGTTLANFLSPIPTAPSGPDATYTTYQYASLRGSSGTENICSTYHLWVKVEKTGSNTDDADAAAGSTKCSSGNSLADVTAAANDTDQFYDVKP
jgi:prepilin-type N-terminal cleavage/methylation domain-containing protein